jgi:hypothetical protein
MFHWGNNHSLENEISERARLNQMTEKELMIEMIIELKKIDRKCDDIARKIVIWSN